MNKCKFIFKDDEYTFTELFNFHKSKKNLFQSGDVINTETGEIFDISEIYDVKNKYYEELNTIKETLNDKQSNILVWALTQNSKNEKIEELNFKFENDDITFEEMELLMKLENNIAYEDRFYVILNRKIGTFYKKYHTFSYPAELTHADIGKLTLLLDFMTYDNEIRRTPRSNSNLPTTQELMDFMRITNEVSLKHFFKKLRDLNIISENIRKRKYRTIYINPLFCDRNIKIYPDLYNAFKEDLDKTLTEKEKKYLQLMDKEIKIGSLTIRR